MQKIFLVDDEKQLCSSLKKSLELTGEFQVETLSDSKYVVTIATKVKPDIILLDVMMPGKSGSAIALELKNDDATKDIPVIFLTALVSAEEVTRQDHLIGGKYFVAKPIDLNVLIRLIKEIT